MAGSGPTIGRLQLGMEPSSFGNVPAKIAEVAARLGWYPEVSKVERGRRPSAPPRSMRW